MLTIEIKIDGEKRGFSIKRTASFQPGAEEVILLEYVIE